LLHTVIIDEEATRKATLENDDYRDRYVEYYSIKYLAAWLLIVQLVTYRLNATQVA
jgi:hypothetical protein